MLMEILDTGVVSLGRASRLRFWSGTKPHQFLRFCYTVKTLSSNWGAYLISEIPKGTIWSTVNPAYIRNYFF